MKISNNCSLHQGLNLRLLCCCPYNWPPEVSKGSQYAFTWLNGQFYHLSSRCHYTIISKRLQRAYETQYEHVRCDCIVLHLSGYIAPPNTIYCGAFSSSSGYSVTGFVRSLNTLWFFLAAVSARLQQMSLFNNWWVISWHFSFREFWFVRVHCKKKQPGPL